MSKKVNLRSEVARARLASQGLTQSSMAELCEVDIRTVQRWMVGQPVRLAEAERVGSLLFRTHPLHGNVETFPLIARPTAPIGNVLSA